MDRDKLYDFLFRVWWWARVYVIYAMILFAILWGIASFSGCANDVTTAPFAPPAHSEPLSLRLSAMMAEMREAGCWPMAFSIAYTNPTNYSISISGKYYDALDRNRTNLLNHTKKGN